MLEGRGKQKNQNDEKVQWNEEDIFFLYIFFLCHSEAMKLNSCQSSAISDFIWKVTTVRN